MKEIRVVGAVIHDKENSRYMITKRDRNREEGGLWEFPGGKVEKGEADEEALVREIQEELKCTVNVEGKLVDHTHEYSYARVRLITFMCSLKEGMPVLTEHEGLRWVTVEEMDSFDFAPADIPTVNYLKINGSHMSYEFSE